MSISNLFVPNDLNLYAESLNLPNGSTGAAGDLNYYEQYNIVAALGGIWATNQSCTIDITRIGNQVTFMLQTDILATATTASTIQLVLSGGIPARFRPVTDIHAACVIENNAAITSSGVLLISAAGILQVSNTGGTNFTGSGLSGVFGFAVNYLTS